ncbi:hypothetical protein [Peribacillus frigoritolerans]|uniref:hypothetical protein n=1 Tax=Peribacillus frigoritolerans TaxID=450367 RepID=UPI00207997F9|nr:hypothetical protein [Peribacillus frigoritolerans]USK77722.1 hypothetical protein LIT31_26565 [Peribacillus frigoritolerans]
MEFFQVEVPMEMVQGIMDKEKITVENEDKFIELLAAKLDKKVYEAIAKAIEETKEEIKK